MTRIKVKVERIVQDDSNESGREITLGMVDDDDATFGSFVSIHAHDQKTADLFPLGRQFYVDIVPVNE